MEKQQLIKGWFYLTRALNLPILISRSSYGNQCVIISGMGKVTFGIRNSQARFVWESIILFRAINRLQFYEVLEKEAAVCNANKRYSRTPRATCTDTGNCPRCWRQRERDLCSEDIYLYIYTLVISFSSEQLTVHLMSVGSIGFEPTTFALAKLYQLNYMNTLTSFSHLYWILLGTIIFTVFISQIIHNID